MKSHLAPYAVIVAGSVLVGGCAALAVDLGFGVAFVNDGVAAAITAYVGGLIAFFVGKRADGHWTQRGLYRAGIGLLLGAGLLGLFRTALLIHFPWTEAGTTGHSPYFILPVAGLVPAVLLEALYQFQHRDK